jgi:cytoskeleton protein RodZ
MTDALQVELDIGVSPGALLRAEREALGMSTRETADRLNWVPDYVALIESDSYEKLRNPAFARGYVKAYTRLVGLDEEALIAAFDRNREENATGTEARKKVRKPLHLQRTGLGVVIGLSVLFLMIAFMWWRSA